MKIIFLDFDGVLNNDKWIHAVFADKKKYISYSERQQDELDPSRVKLISDFAKDVGASIVVSSSWRITHTLEELQTFLYTAGLDRSVNVIDRTPRDYRGYRGAEVKAWLKDHPEVTHHVIFDDDRDFDKGQPLVLTSATEGLQHDHIDLAYGILLK